MRRLVLGLCCLGLWGCSDDVTTAPDLAAAGLADLAVADEGVAPDLTTRACGEPQMQCCSAAGGEATCNPATAVCNAFGVCIACGIYPMACCTGGTCQGKQTCVTDPTAGSFCYPCGHDGQPCCYVGAACVESGSSCVTPDGGNPICSH